jgi:hypothetical protein
MKTTKTTQRGFVSPEGTPQLQELAVTGLVGRIDAHFDVPPE